MSDYLDQTCPDAVAALELAGPSYSTRHRLKAFAPSGNVGPYIMEWWFRTDTTCDDVQRCRNGHAVRDLLCGHFERWLLAAKTTHNLSVHYIIGGRVRATICIAAPVGMIETIADGNDKLTALARLVVAVHEKETSDDE